jgi:CRP/FNR family cyclic AMP-dependent transcriptional regulator
VTLPKRVPDAEALSSALADVPLFRDLPGDDLDLMAQACRVRRFRRGEVIFHQGDPGDALHVIMAGRVKISSPSETGVEAILTTLRPGEFFGALALIDGAPRSATATAVDPSETLVLPRDRFRQLVNERAEVRDLVFTELARELRRLTNHVEELHFLDIAGRLAAQLVRMAEEQVRSRVEAGEPLPAEIVVEGSVTQGELAAMVGSTRQSVNKLLGYFTDDGLIRVERDAIVVVDLPGLQRAARR